jgi:hypothetical protein
MCGRERWWSGAEGVSILNRKERKGRNVKALYYHTFAFFALR